jgi:hypothetical protein
MRTNKRQTSIAGALFGIATIGIYQGVIHSRSNNAARREMLTAQQLASQVAPICHLLTPPGQELRQVTESLYRIGPGGVRRRIWVADCVDSAGNHLVHTVWDAENGLLLAATHRPQRKSNGKTTPVSGGQADRVAWRWLEALGGGRIAPRWTALHPPKANGADWSVVLSSQQYDATILFDKNTQDLVCLMVKERPSPLASL